MVAINKNGGLALGAFETGSDKLIGFVLGFIGRDETSRRYYHYSQMAGTDPQWQSRGVGLALKLAQREAILAQGYDLMRWTFDPLLARNAYFNLAKLGAKCRQYQSNMYGTGRGSLYGQLDTDRLTVDWELDSTHVQERLAAAQAHQKPGQPLADYQATPPVNLTERLMPPVIGLVSVDLQRTEKRLILEIPPNYPAVHQHDLKLADQWRTGARSLFEYYLSGGYYLTDFFTLENETGKQAFYVLEHQA